MRTRTQTSFQTSGNKCPVGKVWMGWWVWCKTGKVWSDKKKTPCVDGLVNFNIAT